MDRQERRKKTQKIQVTQPTDVFKSIGINMLDDYTLMKILEHFSLGKCFYLRSVCRRMKVLLEDIIRRTERVDMQRMNGNRWWKSCGQISHQTIDDLDLNVDFEKLLKSYLVYTPRLKAIHIYMDTIDEKLIQLLVESDFFRERTLEHLEITNCTFIKFCSLSAEETWNEFFAGLQQLKHFVFVDNSGILPPARKFLRSLAKCEHLEALALDLDQLKSSRVMILKDISFSNLRIFQLTSNLLTLSPHLSPNLLKNIEVINFRNVCLSPNQLQVFQDHLPNLRILNFALYSGGFDTNDYNSLFQCICLFQNLEELRIGNQNDELEDLQWGNVFASSPSPMYKLREIRLSNVHLKADFVRGLLENCPNLRVFYASCFLSTGAKCFQKEGFLLLAALPHIREIGLEGFDVLDETLQKLVSMKTGLRTLEICMTNNPTTNAVSVFRELAKSRPEENFELRLFRIKSKLDISCSDIPPNLNVMFTRKLKR